MAVDMPSAEPGAVIPGYRVTGTLPLGAGEGEVYDAQTEDGRQVELCVMPAKDKDFAARFVEQAQALGELEHDHLPRVVDSGESDGSVYIATDPVEGRSLEELIRETDGLSPMRAIRVLGEAADALDAAHSVDVPHGALSASDVIVEERPLERAVLQGFALGAPTSRRTRDDDVRAFARLMFECFTGAPPPRGGGRATALLPSRIPAALEYVLAQGLSEEHGSRPASAAELVAEAARAVMAATRPPTPAAAEPVPTTETALVPTAVEPTRVPLRRRLAGATVPFAIAVLVVGAAAVGGWLIGKPESGATPPKQVSSGNVELGIPAGWRETRAPRRLGTLRLASAVAAKGASGARVDAGIVPGTLPARVGARVARHPGDPGAVKLGDLQAYVWRDVAERGSGAKITLLAAGTDGGLVALACRGPAAAVTRCERSASSLALAGALPAELGELSAWTGRLDSTMRKLVSARHTGRAQLHAARTAHGRSKAGRKLAGTYSTAAHRLDAQRAPIGAEKAQSAILRSLRAVASAYRTLASAASHGRTGSYNAALRSISSRESSLKRTLNRL
ncbi:MAG: serine/threonine protein kinase [Thermoleophilaceae bacterium]